jgi:hypothetical protein
MHTVIKFLSRLANNLQRRFIRGEIVQSSEALHFSSLTGLAEGLHLSMQSLYYFQDAADIAVPAIAFNRATYLESSERTKMTFRTHRYEHGH